MKNINIPIPLIVACFVFGAWPIGVFLLILRSVSESNKEEAKKEQNGKNNTASSSSAKHTVYHSKYQTKDSVEPDTTYHYSYIKKNTADGHQQTTQGANTTPKEDASKTEMPKVDIPKKMTDVTKKSSAAFDPIKKKYKTCAATVLSTVFMGVSLFFAFIFFVNAVDSVFSIGLLSSMEDVVATMIASSISAILYLFRQYYKSRDYRIITYLSVLRGKKFYSIKTLADIADVSVGRVIKDLHFMQSKELLGQYALIDKKMQYLIITADGREDAVAEYERSMGLTRTEAKAVRAEAKTEATKDLTEHEKILHRIRELNDDIDDAVVSQKIDEIEEVTRKIFNLVEEKPELESQLDSFLSYYLPTTLKLLNSYAYFEEQGVRGENISAGMKNIEETLDMLISGYRNQLDKLFESDTLDVTTDINVLEQMMKADGFTKYSDFDVSAEAKSFSESGFGGAAVMSEEDQTQNQ